ncbi:MAG: purine-nucleoside phosphorylase [Planctomyces sp.]|nr:purine-nucleoside phosphorylase [Planctomyces sp.]
MTSHHPIEASENPVSHAASFVRERLQLNADQHSDKCMLGVILGSGLGGAADRLMALGGRDVLYAEIPGMPATGVAGHTGRLICGQVHGVTVLMLQGRVHTYEGRSAADVTFGTRLLSELGASGLIVTNAAGGIRDGFRPGDLMLIDGHLSLFQPGTERINRSSATTRGTSTAFDVPRTASDSGVLWDQKWISSAHRIATPLTVYRGIYAMMPGPCYETPAEIRMLRTLGADAVGMSTIPEALCAVHCGMRTLGVSCITNVAAGLSSQTLHHAEVTATANQIAAAFQDWLWAVIRTTSQQS